LLVARVENLDFETFVEQRRQNRPSEKEGDSHAYAYVSDKNTRAAFERMKAVELAVAAGVRMFKNVGKAELLGHAVKVGPRQFPRVHALAEQSAETLGISTPTLYVVNNPHLNAATYGTNDDSFVMIHSALVDHLADEELLSVIGHECGHIHNCHVVYLTAMHYLSHMAGMFIRSIGLPALLALRAWSRRAEVTCDRAGALCAGDLDISMRALTKLALGSRKLYDQLDMDAFLEQHEEAQASVGRYSEVFATHPWLPKRVLALRTFGESALFRRHAGLGEDGLTMEQVDEKVHGIIKVVG
jgi:Zn-dependent protease with chaperone function